MTEEQFTIVMPIKLENIELDLERLFDVNLASLEKFFDQSYLREIILVTGARDAGWISKCTKKMPLFHKVRLIDECEFCPALKKMGGSGWVRQQIIKIAAASKVSTKYILAYDDDIIMTRRASIQDLVLRGQLIMSPIPAGYHPHFIESSCAVLRYPRENFSAHEIVMSATPEILMTEFLLGLQKEIESIWQVNDFAEWLLRASVSYSDPLGSKLAKRIQNRIFRKQAAAQKRYFSDLRGACGHWTEYSLYWTYLKKHDLTQYYHDYGTKVSAPRLGDRGVWTNEDSMALDLDEWIGATFDPSLQHYFSVFSAKITNVDRRLLYQKIKKRLNASSPPN